MNRKVAQELVKIAREIAAESVSVDKLRSALRSYKDIVDVEIDDLYERMHKLVIQFSVGAFVGEPDPKLSRQISDVQEELGQMMMLLKRLKSQSRKTLSKAQKAAIDIIQLAEE